MTVIEAREALTLTLRDIAGGATEKNLTADIRCFIADHDLNALSDDNLAEAALVAGEITIGKDDIEEKLVLECAVSVNDGEVSSEEMLREVNVMRDSMKELCEKMNESESAADAFNAVVPEEEAPAPVHVYDNKKFYIACGIGAAVLIVLVLLIGGLFK